MKFPDKFPPGCSFVASFSGDEFVEFPDGRVFKASDDGAELVPVRSLPARGAAPMSEDGFLSCAAKSRAFAAKAA
ncbi:MAG: hypothetical protein HYZ20_14400 [Burkholderiales bacterium]|nr:hypothetical protein [Burkholderiales bacterium]